MDMRTERVVLETDRHMITGDLHLPKEGYRSRLSDFLNHGDVSFISLVDVEVRPIAGGEPPQLRSFVAVAREHVKLAYPFRENGAPLS
jgi:hypothetical protein